MTNEVVCIPAVLGSVPEVDGKWSMANDRVIPELPGKIVRTSELLVDSANTSTGEKSF